MKNLFFNYKKEYNMPTKSIPKNVINPFSEAFIPTWDLWKSFRWEEHKFQYKGVISEQMALKRLVTVSSGEEEKAVRIVEQSISRGWMDFYDLKQPNPNGKSKQSTSETKPTESERLRKEATDELMRRNGNGEQQGDGAHLKAV